MLALAAATPLPSAVISAAAITGAYVALVDAVGSVLAAPLVASTPLPPFDAAAMDGWAVSGPGPWGVTGRLLAGDTLDRLPKVEGTPGEIHVSQDLTRLLNVTDKLAQQRGDQYVSSEFFALAAAEDRGELGKLLKSFGSGFSEADRQRHFPGGDSRRRPGGCAERGRPAAARGGEEDFADGVGRKTGQNGQDSIGGFEFSGGDKRSDRDRGGNGHPRLLPRAPRRSGASGYSGSSTGSVATPS